MTALKFDIIGNSSSGEKAFHKVGAAADETRGRFSKISHIAAGVFGGAVLAESAEKAIEFLKEGAAEAMQSQQAQERLTVALENNAHANKEEADAIGESLTKMSETSVFAKGDLFQAYTQLVTATHNTAKAHNLLSLAMNVSAGTGRPLTAVSLALAKAQNGNVSALSRLGVATKDAHGKTMTLNEITKKLADTYRDQASKQGETLAGKMIILRNRFSEFREHLVAKVLPTLLNVANYLAKVGDWVQKNSSWLVPLISGVLSAAAAFVVITKAIALFNLVMEANPIVLIITALAALVVALVLAYKHSQTFRNIVQEALHAVAVAGKWMWDNFLKPTFDAMRIGWGIIGTVFKWVWDNVLHPVFSVLGSGIKTVGTVLSAFSGTWSKIWTAIGNAIKWVWDHTIKPIIDAISGSISAIQNAVNALPGMGKSVTQRGPLKPGTVVHLPHGGTGTVVGSPSGFARGGVFLPRAGGTLGSVNGHLGTFAEAGEAEAVMPLSYLNRLLSSGSSSGPSVVINVTALPGSEQAVAREITRLLAKYNRGAGNLSRLALYT